MAASLLLCVTLRAADPGAVRSLGFPYAQINTPIAGVAGDRDVVFVGAPLNGSVIVLSQWTGKQIGALPPPPNGFAVPFIMLMIGEGRVAILDAGVIPHPIPFVPANPVLY